MSPEMEEWIRYFDVRQQQLAQQNRVQAQQSSYIGLLEYDMWGWVPADFGLYYQVFPHMYWIDLQYQRWLAWKQQQLYGDARPAAVADATAEQVPTGDDADGSSEVTDDEGDESDDDDVLASVNPSDPDGEEPLTSPTGNSASIQVATRWAAEDHASSGFVGFVWVQETGAWYYSPGDGRLIEPYRSRMRRDGTIVRRYRWDSPEAGRWRAGMYIYPDGTTVMWTRTPSVGIGPFTVAHRARGGSRWSGPTEIRPGALWGSESYAPASQNTTRRRAPGKQDAAPHGHPTEPVAGTAQDPDAAERDLAPLSDDGTGSESPDTSYSGTQALAGR